MKSIKNFSQIIIWVVTISLGIILNHEQIPGNKNICDSGQREYAFAWVVFVIGLLYLLISSWKNYNENYRNIFSQISLIISVVAIIISLSIRPLIFILLYGSEKAQYENLSNEFPFKKLKLYNNGKFYSWTYDASCQNENIGRYELKGNQLALKFEYEKPKCFGTEYTLKDNEIKCLNCESKMRLKIKN